MNKCATWEKPNCIVGLKSVVLLLETTDGLQNKKPAALCEFCQGSRTHIGRESGFGRLNDNLCKIMQLVAHVVSNSTVMVASVTAAQFKFGSEVQSSSSCKSFQREVKNSRRILGPLGPGHRFAKHCRDSSVSLTK